ncbi:MAG: tetraacyldisaccharide 4'-kinase [Elusimicrobiota bacterium]|jgi:tetraacyldisaccharide 4'-kinase
MSSVVRKEGRTRGADHPWWEQILRGERQDLLAQSVRRFAKLSSWGYAAGVKGRQLAYRRGWFPVKRLPHPTICVGNITVGGTGKTPLVMRLASDLLARGLRPAVLLRGYKREQKRRHPVLVRNAQGICASVAESGDEAMELATRLPGACIGVGADRYAVGQFILKHQRVDCFILDDGFQHHRLDRDINIVTVDVNDPWGGGKLLPAGFLRESPEALRRADAVVLTRTSSVGPDRLAVLRAEVSMRMRESSCLLESRHEPRELIALVKRNRVSLSELRGKRVLVASGIGNPEAFEATLTNLGAQIVGSLRLADHENRAEAVWDWVSRNKRAIDWILMTEKDAMRWVTASAPPAALARSFVLRVELVISQGHDHWTRLLDLIQQLIHAR